MTDFEWQEVINKNLIDLDNPEHIFRVQEDYFNEIAAQTMRLALELNVSEACAGKVEYLRTRSRWSQKAENELIRLDKAGELLPVVFNGDF